MGEKSGRERAENCYVIRAGVSIFCNGICGDATCQLEAASPSKLSQATGSLGTEALF